MAKAKKKAWGRSESVDSLKLVAKGTPKSVIKIRMLFPLSLSRILVFITDFGGLFHDCVSHLLVIRGHYR